LKILNSKDSEVAKTPFYNSYYFICFTCGINSKISKLRFLKRQAKQGVMVAYLCIIIATWEAEIRRIPDLVYPKHKRKISETHLNRKNLDMVMCTCHPSLGRKCKV
jgi:hypothetical protein